jgi:hypothetical protein
MSEKQEFLAKTLGQDLKKNVKRALSKEVKEDLTKDIRIGKNILSKLKFVSKLSSFLLVFIVILFFLFYLFQIENIHLSKPELTKPSTDSIDIDQVKYLLLNGGAYKLHNSLISGEPAVTLVWILDTGQKFTSINGYVVERKNVEKYDILVSLDSKTFKEIISSQDINFEIKRQMNREKLTILEKSPKLDLALKGYPGFKNVLFPNENKISIFSSLQLKLIYMIITLILVILTALHLVRN